MSNYNKQDGINLNGDPKSDTIDFEVPDQTFSFRKKP